MSADEPAQVALIVTGRPTPEEVAAVVAAVMVMHGQATAPHDLPQSPHRRNAELVARRRSARADPVFTPREKVS